MPKPLSISNFEPPALPWKRVLPLALVFFLCGIFALEGLWRSRDYAPGLVDSAGYWAVVRSDVDFDDDHQVVLVGTSRFQMGLDPEVMAEVAPEYRFTQLAVTGGNPLPVLENLAQSGPFKGIVLLEYMPSHLSTEAGDSTNADTYLAAFNGPSLVSGPEHRIRAGLQSTLVSMHADLNLKTIARSMMSSRTLPAAHRSMKSSRFVDTTRVDRAALEGKDVKLVHTVESPVILSDAELEARLVRLENAIDTIRDGGGEVVVFRPNSSGAFKVVEGRRFPRERFYEPTRRRIGGRWLHYEDDEVLSQLECPDGSHVIGEDATTMSARVASLLFGG